MILVDYILRKANKKIDSPEIGRKERQKVATVIKVYRNEVILSHPYNEEPVSIRLLWGRRSLPVKKKSIMVKQNH